MNLEVKPVFSTFLDDIYTTKEYMQTPSGFNVMSRGLVTMPMMRWGAFETVEKQYYLVLHSRQRAYLLSSTAKGLEISHIPRQIDSFRQVYYVVPPLMPSEPMTVDFDKMSGLIENVHDYHGVRMKNVELQEHLVHVPSRGGSQAVRLSQGLLSQRLGEATLPGSTVAVQNIQTHSIDDIVDVNVCGSFLCVASPFFVQVQCMYPTMRTVCVLPSTSEVTSVALHVCKDHPTLSLIICVGTVVGVQQWYFTHAGAPVMVAQYLIQQCVIGVSMEIVGSQLLLAVSTRDYRLQFLDLAKGLHTPVVSSGSQYTFAEQIHEESLFLERHVFCGKPSLFMQNADVVFCSVASFSGDCITFKLSTHEKDTVQQSSEPLSIALIPLADLQRGGDVATHGISSHRKICTIEVSIEQRAQPSAAVNPTDLSNVYRDSEWSTNISYPSLHLPVLGVLLAITYQKLPIGNSQPGQQFQFQPILSFIPTNQAQQSEVRYAQQCDPADCVVDVGCMKLKGKPTVVVLFASGLVQMYRFPKVVFQSNVDAPVPQYKQPVYGTHDCFVEVISSQGSLQLQTADAALELQIPHQHGTQISVCSVNKEYIFAVVREQHPFLTIYSLSSSKQREERALVLLEPKHTVLNMGFHAATDSLMILFVVYSSNLVKLYSFDLLSNKVSLCKPATPLLVPPQGKLLTHRQIIPLYPALATSTLSSNDQHCFNLYLSQDGPFLTVFSVVLDSDMHTFRSQYLIIPKPTSSNK